MGDRIVFSKNKDIVTREIEGETILLPIYKSSQELDCIYALNNCASFVWKLIDGKKTLGQIKKEIAANFDSDSEVIDKAIKLIFQDFKKINAVIQKKISGRPF